MANESDTRSWRLSLSRRVRDLPLERIRVEGARTQTRAKVSATVVRDYAAAMMQQLADAVLLGISANNGHGLPAHRESDRQRILSMFCSCSSPAKP